MPKDHNNDVEERDAEAIIKAAKFDAKSLRGEVADFFISQMKAARFMKPWDELTEDEQREMCRQAMDQATQLIGGVAGAMMAKAMPHSAAKLGKFSGAVGESTIEVKAEIMMTEEIGKKLAGGVTDAVLVFGSLDVWMGGEMTTQPEANQKSLLPTDGDGNALAADADGVVIDDKADAANDAAPPASKAGKMRAKKEAEPAPAH